MSTVIDALAKAERDQGAKQSGGEGPTLPPEPPRRSRFWRFAAGLVVLLVLAFAGGLFSSWQTVDIAALEPGNVTEEDPQATGVMASRDEAAGLAAPQGIPVGEQLAMVEPPAGSGAEPAEPGLDARADPGLRRDAQLQARADALAAAGPDPDAAAVVSARRQLALSRREERRERRKQVRATQLAKRRELAEAREMARGGKLTPQELRDFRRDQQEEIKEARRAEREELRARRAEREVASSQGEREAAPIQGDAAMPTLLGDEGAVAPSALVQASVGPAAEPIEEEPAAAAETAIDGGEKVVAVATTTGPPPTEPPVARRSEIRRWSPAGLPQVAIQILQWSRDDARRFAFVSVDGGRATQVREGDELGVLRVTRIYREVIEFGHAGGTFLLSAN